MIYGIGTDMVEIGRIEASIEKFGDGFAERILAESEMQGYLETSIKSRFLAKRFAVKEAFSKALGTGLREPATFQNIAVAHDGLGKPMLVVVQALQDFLTAKNINNMHLTISDEKSLAIAFVVLES